MAAATTSANRLILAADVAAVKIADMLAELIAERLTGIVLRGFEHLPVTLGTGE